MFVFAHLGIGNTLAAPFRRGLARRWILVGTLLPDLIDKPIYYGASWATGRQAEDLGLISGTRTFGHTALTLGVLAVSAIVSKSRILAALCVGMATHLLLDGITDAYWTSQGAGPIASALGWPFTTSTFPVIPFHSVGEHLGTFRSPFFVVSECLGGALLAWDFWKSNNRVAILAFFRQRRLSLKWRRRRDRVVEKL